MGSNASRPAVTAPQVIGVLLAGVPLVAQLLHVFGVYTLTPDQQSALRDVVTWGTVSAGSLFGADAALRSARNHAHAKVEAQRVWRTPEPPSGPSPAVPVVKAAPVPPVPKKPRTRPVKPKPLKP